MQCQSCGSDIPADGQFCIECGARVPGEASTGPTVHLASAACRSCGAANPGEARFCVRCGQPVNAAPRAYATPEPLARPAAVPSLARRQRRGRRYEGAVGIVFLLALGAMLLFKLPIWPGILIVCGLIAFFVDAMRGRYVRGLGGALWLFGLAFLFTVPRLLLPGIFALVGVSVLVQIARRAFGVW